MFHRKGEMGAIARGRVAGVEESKGFCCKGKRGTIGRASRTHLEGPTMHLWNGHRNTIGKAERGTIIRAERNGANLAIFGVARFIRRLNCTVAVHFMANPYVFICS